MRKKVKRSYSAKFRAKNLKKIKRNVGKVRRGR